MNPLPGLVLCAVGLTNVLMVERSQCQDAVESAGRVLYVRRNVTSGALVIWSMATDGSGTVQLTDNETGEVDPAWSPDGGRIAHFGKIDGRQGICTMNRIGFGHVLVRELLGSDRYACPQWSADGGRLLFTAVMLSDPPLAAVVAVDPDGANLQQLTPGDALNMLGDRTAFFVPFTARVSEAAE